MILSTALCRKLCMRARGFCGFVDFVSLLQSTTPHSSSPAPTLRAFHHSHRHQHGVASSNGQICRATRSICPFPHRPSSANPIRIDYRAASAHGAGLGGGEPSAWRGCQHGTLVRILKELAAEEVEYEARQGSVVRWCWRGGTWRKRRRTALSTRTLGANNASLAEWQLPGPLSHICSSPEETVP